jgi:hypothetical protein
MEIETVWSEERLAIDDEEGELVLLAVPSTLDSEHHHFTLTAAGEESLLEFLWQRAREAAQNEYEARINQRSRK